MVEAREIKYYNANDKEAIKSVFAILNEHGFIVLEGDDKCFLIISLDKSLKQIDDAIYNSLQIKYIRVRQENSFKEVERV
jgi:hypothetical protein